MHIQLRRYLPDAVTPAEVMDVIEIQASAVASATATLTFKVSLAVGEGIREWVEANPGKPFIVAIEYSTGGAWVEPRGSRFVAYKGDADDSDPAKVISITCMDWASWQLTRTYLHWANDAVDGERTWSDATPGAIFGAMLAESKVRGWAPAMTAGFTATQDAAGVAWAASDRTTQAYRLLTPLSQVLQSMTSQGLCDWWTEGTALRLFRSGVGADKTGITLGGDGFSRAPGGWDASGVFTHLTVVPEKAWSWLYLTNAGADDSLGRTELTMTQSGIADHATATRLAQPALIEGRTAKREQSYEWTVSGAMPKPWVDFNLHDLVTIDTAFGRRQESVVELVVRTRGDVATCVAVTGGKILSNGAKRDRRAQSAIIGGIIGGSGNGLPGASSPSEVAPLAPTELALSSTHGWAVAGEPFAIIAGTFMPVVGGADGGSIAIAGYELFGRENVPGTPWRKITDVPGDSSDISYSPLPVGEDWQFKLRAVSTRGVVGDFSDIVTLPLSADVTPPPRPAAPTATARLGQIAVSWNGATVSGEALPEDFSHADVVMATTAAGAGVVVGQITPSGTFVAPEQPYNASRWFSLVAVDSSGNRSAESPRVTVTVTPLVDTDIIGRVLDGANIKLDSIQAEVIAAGAISSEKISDDVKATITAAQADADAAQAEAAVAKADAATAIAEAEAALTEAAEATAGASQALSAADAANAAALQAALEAGNALATADGKNRIYPSTGEPAGDTRNLLADPSFEGGGVPVEVRRNYYPMPTVTSVAGNGLQTGGLAYATPGVAGTYSNLQGWQAFSPTSIPAGGRFGFYRVILDVSYAVGDRLRAIVRFGNTAPAGLQWRLRVDGRTPSVSVVVNDVTTQARDLILESTVTTAFSGVNFYVWLEPVGSADWAGSGVSVRASWFTLEKNSVGGPVFSANSPSPDPDLTVAWSGPSNDSHSVLSGVRPAGTIMGNGEALVSERWARTGKASVRLVTRNASTTSTLIIADEAGAYRGKLDPGKTYTLLATRHIDAPLTGALNPQYAGRAALIQTGFASQASDVILPNEAGDHELRWTFTTDPGMTTATLRLGHGGAVYSGDVWWDDVMLVEGEYDGPFTQRFTQGDQWWVLNTEGTQIVGVRVWNGSAFVDYQMVADSLLVPGSVTAGTIATNAVTAGKVAADAITAREILAGSVVADKIASNAVTSDKIIANAITTVKIAADAVTADKIFANAVTADKIAANAVTTVKLAADSVTAAKILAGSITTAKIAADAVTANEIAANAVTAEQILAEAVTAGKIGALAVSAGNIQANAVTADKIMAGAITAVKIEGQAITGDKIAGNAIDGKTITGAIVRTAASGARSVLDASGLTIFNGSGQALVQVGQGVSKGMAVRNPLTNSMVPLADAAFGSVTVARNDKLDYSMPASETPAFQGGPGTWAAWTRHGSDTLSMTFTAVAPRYIITFGQVWACSRTNGDATVYVTPTVNGVRVETTSGPYFTTTNTMNVSSTVIEARMGSCLGGVPITTTPGQSYTIQLQFRTRGWSTAPIISSLNDRFITATPSFS